MDCTGTAEDAAVGMVLLGTGGEDEMPVVDQW